MRDLGEDMKKWASRWKKKKVEIKKVNDIVNQWQNTGNYLYFNDIITELYSEYGFFERLSKIEKDFPGANIILHKYGVEVIPYL